MRRLRHSGCIVAGRTSTFSPRWANPGVWACDNAVSKNEDGILQRRPAAGACRLTTRTTAPFLMADSADLAASPNSRAPRARSAKRRETTVSTETENKLARAARSAQRLAQLSDVPRDDSTFDLFPDDPTRATLEAMTIDIRQGTLTGFELPAEVLAAVGITDDGDALAGESKLARRVTRAAKVDEAASLSRQASVLDERIEPSVTDTAGVETTLQARAPGAAVESVHDAGSNVTATAVAGVAQMDMAAATATSADPVAESQADVATEVANPARNASAKRTAVSAETSAKPAAAASVASGQRAPRAVSPVIPAAPSASSAGLRQAATARTNEAAPSSQLATASPRFASTFAKAASAAGEGSPAGDAASTTLANAPRASSSGAQAQSTQPGAASRTFGMSQTSTATNSAAPELDRARATAFADTVDALYGVIADQRRAATDHSRRMKWMLSIVVAALLVTVAIGITQTMLLMRLTHDSTTQQQRIEQMMLNQQATLSTLLDTDSATVSAPAIVPVTPAAPAAPEADAAPRPAAPPASPKHTARTPHAHKAKTPATH